MSDATLYTASIVEETVYGTTPASALQLINVTSFDLQRPRSIERPNVLTGDRRRHANVVLQDDGSLTVPSPLQYLNNLLLMEGVQGNDIDAAFAETQTDIVIDTSGTITTVAGDFSALNAGDWIFVAGATTAGNNGWKGPIVSATTTVITVPASQVTTDGAATVTIQTQSLNDGIIEKSYSVEWEDTGLTNRFRGGTGMSVQSATWSWAEGSFATESYELIGQAPVKSAATIGTGGPTAALTTDFMNSVDNWGSIFIAETASTHIISDLTLTVTNQLNPVRGLGSIGPSAITFGNQDIALTATILYDDNSDALFAQIEDHDTISIFWEVVDDQSNHIGFFVPALKADDGQPNVGEAGNQVSFTLTASGHDPAKDTASAYTSSGFDRQFAIFFSVV